MTITGGEILTDFKKRFPKQSKATGIVYSGTAPTGKIGRIIVYQILVSDEGLFELKEVIFEHPRTKKTAREWSAWLDKYYPKILGYVIEAQERERGQLWKVRAILGWSADDFRRGRTKVAKRKRRKASKKRS